MVLMFTLDTILCNVNSQKSYGKKLQNDGVHGVTYSQIQIKLL